MEESVLEPLVTPSEMKKSETMMRLYLAAFDGRRLREEVRLRGHPPSCHVNQAAKRRQVRWHSRVATSAAGVTVVGKRLVLSLSLGDQKRLSQILRRELKEPGFSASSFATKAISFYINRRLRAT
jgi:hypothetical protein